jgi:hypothetical protein
VRWLTPEEALRVLSYLPPKMQALMRYAHLAPGQFIQHASVVDRQLRGTVPSQAALCQ